MLRSFLLNLKNVVSCNRFVYSSVSNTSMLKRLESTNTPENVEKIEKCKFEELKRFRQAEVHIWHSVGTHKYINPALITEEQWQHLYKTETKHQRKRYCEFLLTKMQAKTEKKSKKIAEREEKAKQGIHEKILAERAANSHIVYGLGHNSLILRVTRKTINKWINMKMHWKTKLFGQKIVIDCSFENQMTHLEQSKMVKGLERLYSENRKHKKPLDLHLCGLLPNSNILKKLSRQIPIIKKGSPTGIHTKCYTEIFPKERLVMLTPDSNQVLDYKFDDIYIIGGIVDMGRNDPLTMAKAQKLGLRTARLPLDDLRMGPGDSRELPMSSVASFIRECQLSRNLNEIIEKSVYLRSKKKAEKDKKFKSILEES